MTRDVIDQIVSCGEACERWCDYASEVEGQGYAQPSLWEARCQAAGYAAEAFRLARTALQVAA